jgi:CrcB protein
MRDFLAVALGGMLGSVARHAVNLVYLRFWPTAGWPLATLTVNVVGCFLAGLFIANLKRWPSLDSSWDMAVRVGFLGGLTTFSSFGLEVVRLGQVGKTSTAILVVCLNVALGLLAVLAGELVFRLFSR